MADNKDSKTTYNITVAGGNITAVGNHVTVNVYLSKDEDPQLNAEKNPSDTRKPSQEMNMKAGQKESVIYKASSVLEESEDNSHPAVFETTVKTKADEDPQLRYPSDTRKPSQEMNIKTKVKTKADIKDANKPTLTTSKTRLRLPSFMKRFSLKRRSGGKTVRSEELTSKDRSDVLLKNEGYADSPHPVRRFSPTSDKMCGQCLMNGEKQLPDNHDKWPIDKIEHGCFEEICRLIDLSDRNSKHLMATLEFAWSDAESITQQFATQGGLGVAKKALGIWGSGGPSHNVGALKEILKYEIKRFDALREIENWEKMSVCHGCGIKIKHSPKQQQ